MGRKFRARNAIGEVVKSSCARLLKLNDSAEDDSAVYRGPIEAKPGRRGFIKSGINILILGGTVTRAELLLCGSVVVFVDLVVVVLVASVRRFGRTRGNHNCVRILSPPVGR